MPYVLDAHGQEIAASSAPVPRLCYAVGTMRFKHLCVFQHERFAIGHDTETKQHYISFPVSNRMVDYEEYYALTPDESARLEACIGELRTLVAECRAHREDERLIMKPGSDRGTPS